MPVLSTYSYISCQLSVCLSVCLSVYMCVSLCRRLAIVSIVTAQWRSTSTEYAFTRPLVVTSSSRQAGSTCACRRALDCLALWRTLSRWPSSRTGQCVSVEVVIVCWPMVTCSYWPMTVSSSGLIIFNDRSFSLCPSDRKLSSAA